MIGIAQLFQPTNNGLPDIGNMSVSGMFTNAVTEAHRTFLSQVTPQTETKQDPYSYISMAMQNRDKIAENLRPVISAQGGSMSNTVLSSTADYASSEFPTTTSNPSGLGSNVTDFVKSFEGYNPRAYADNKQYSVGYGTRARSSSEQITREEAERRLGSELSLHRQRVDRINKKYGYNFTPEQRDALTSFDYNTGRLEQLTANGKRDKSAIAAMFTQYDKSGGTRLKGLTRRRMAEQALFTKGY